MKFLRYVLTYFLTSSSLVRLNSFRIFEALFGPLILGFSISVSPGRSLSPFFTMTKFNTERSGLTMHPRTDFLLRSPFLLPCPRKHGVPKKYMHQSIINQLLKPKKIGEVGTRTGKTVSKNQLPSLTLPHKLLYFNIPLWSKRRTRPGVNTPCFIGKPCLSHPPIILNT